MIISPKNVYKCVIFILKKNLIHILEKLCAVDAKLWVQVLNEEYLVKTKTRILVLEKEESMKYENVALKDLQSSVGSQKERK